MTYRVKENQCTAMVTPSLTGRRCRRDAEPDTDPPRCDRHMWTSERRGPNGHYMTRFYLKTLRPTLAAALEKAIDGLGPVEQLDLSEELSLMRVVAADAVEKYAEAHEIGQGTEKGTELRLIAGQLVADKLKDVAAMAESCSKVADMKVKLQGAFSSVMSDVITSIVHAAWEVFGDDFRVRDFETLLRKKLEERSVPGVVGTDITPDQDVIAMDETVPSSHEETSDAVDLLPGDDA